jgi:hypothetical protein
MRRNSGRPRRCSPPTTASASPCSRAIETRSGSSARQASHHVAKTERRSGRPRNECSDASAPSSVRRVKSAGTSPTVPGAGGASTSTVGTPPSPGTPLPRTNAARTCRGSPDSLHATSTSEPTRERARARRTRWSRRSRRARALRPHDGHVRLAARAPRHRWSVRARRATRRARCHRPATRHRHGRAAGGRRGRSPDSKCAPASSENATRTREAPPSVYQPTTTRCPTAATCGPFTGQPRIVQPSTATSTGVLQRPSTWRTIARSRRSSAVRSR